MTNNNKINDKECKREAIHLVDRHLQQHRSSSSEGLPREVADVTQSHIRVRPSRKRRGRYDPSPVRRRIPQSLVEKASSHEEDVFAQSLWGRQMSGLGYRLLPKRGYSSRRTMDLRHTSCSPQQERRCSSMEQRRTGHRSRWSCRQRLHKSNGHTQTRPGSRSLSNAKVQAFRVYRSTWRVALGCLRCRKVAPCSNNLPRCLHQTAEQVVWRLPWLEGYPYRRLGYTYHRSLP